MSFTFPSRSVVNVLDSVAAIYGYPKYLRIDNELSANVKPPARNFNSAGRRSAPGVQFPVASPTMQVL